MNVLTSIPFFKSKVPRQVLVDSWDMRDAILESDVNLFCWKRPVDIVISSYLGQILEKDLESITFHTDITQLDQEIERVRPSWDQEPKQAADLFWQDVSSLISDFLQYSGNKSGTIHLKVIDNNACTKFHIDGYTLRLFTTYVGPGTEWVTEKGTHRKSLGKTNALIVKDQSEVQHMDPFEVGILKGEVPGAHSSVKGIVHRSPEIIEKRERRIILRVDI